MTFTSIAFTKFPFKSMVRIICFYCIFWLFIIPLCNFNSFRFVKNSDNYLCGIRKFTISYNNSYCVLSLLFIINRSLNGNYTSRIDRIICSIGNYILRCCFILVSCCNLANLTSIIFLYRTSCILNMDWFINISYLNYIGSSISCTTRILCNNSNLNFWSFLIIKRISKL